MYKIINDATTALNYTENEVLNEVPFNLLMLRLFTYYEGFKPKKKESEGVNLADL